MALSPSMIEINFSDDRCRTAHSACTVCAGRKSVHVLDAVSRGSTHELFRCEHCGSLFYDTVSLVSAYSDVRADDGLWLDYVQAGAGISSMLAPLFALNPVPGGSLLDVGCGFGFIVDFWSSRGLKAIGLEPSGYGEIGRTKLGIDVRQQTLEDFLRENPEFRANVVFSSEVIEHVRSPSGFVDALLRAVTDDGVVVLTTPAPESIHPDAPLAAMIAALSPGFHYTLIAPSALEGFFTSRGFNCRTIVSGAQTLCWASRKALPEIDLQSFRWSDYFDYLETRADHTDPHIATGALSRLFKDALNTGNEARAGTAYDRLLQLSSDCFGIDLHNPEIAGLLALRKPLSGLRRYPSWLGGALLFGGIHVGHRFNDRRTKLRMLDAALRVLARRADVDLQFGQEAAHFLPFAERQYVIALSEALTVSIGGRAPPPEPDLGHTLRALLPVVAKFVE
jgi:SAM-dependent methyltransferase